MTKYCQRLFICTNRVTNKQNFQNKDIKVVFSIKPVIGGREMSHRFLTKSRFKLAMECPTKLYYTGKEEYINQTLDDSFLLALAEGGFQVGELAKHYFSGGYTIEALDYEESLRETNELLSKDKVIIYEAAIRYEKFFIRTDILIKEGRNIKLIEVKAKSADDFYNKKGIKPAWMPYLYDVAFQKHVVSKVFPDYKVTAYLMLADKEAKCPTERLNQKFRVIEENGRKKIKVSGKISEEDLTPPILCKINAEDACRIIYSEDYEFNNNTLSFSELINTFAENYHKDLKMKSGISKNCKGCEFKATEDEIKAGYKSGYHECWKEVLGWKDKDFEIGTIFDIWDFRTADKLISEGRIKLTEITEDDINIKPADKPGVSRTERQWMQINKSQNNDTTYWIDKDNLSMEMDSWTYPLHFIDFETSMAAIPFNKGRRPYEGIAFQFSHHIVYENGDIEHKGQYLNTEPGVFPNYDFVRKLKAALDKDKGTIFRYAAHENTFLNIIYRQLEEDKNHISDKEELCEFIRSITKSVNGSFEGWEGPRNMVDMCELVKRYYYDPATKGSNSIKAVLPAILNSSAFLQDKYSKPVYGTKDIPSLNYSNWTWIKYENNTVTDPYKLLPKMFEDISDKDFILLNNDQLRDGGAAMTAYAMLQFAEMSDYERNEIKKALLKYCELDTFAMVMIYEGWKEMIK